MKGPGYPWSSGFSPLSLSWLGTERKLKFFFVLSGMFDSDPIAGVWFPRQFELLTLAQLLYVSLWCSVSTAPPPWAVFPISETESLPVSPLLLTWTEPTCAHSPCCPGLFTQLLLSWTLLWIPDSDPMWLLLSPSLLFFVIDSPEHFGSLPHIMSLRAELDYVDNYRICSVWGEKN